MKALSIALAAASLLLGLGGCGDTGKEELPEQKVEPSAAAAPAVTEEEDAREEEVPTAAETPTEAPAETPPAEPASLLEDGVYLAAFDTDSSMFHVNEAWNGKGILRVEDGQMTIHIVMPSKNIVNLFRGTAAEAEAEGAVLIDPQCEEVRYSDGLTEEVYAYDVPVPLIGEEFDCALIGTKGKWYDHKVVVSDPEPYTEAEELPADGEYSIDAYVEGGTGKAWISSPAGLKVTGGAMLLTIEWSSPYYDYMIVGGEKYLPVNTEGNSVFEIPIESLNEDIPLTADTTAMSSPHEIGYILHLDSSTLH